MKIFKNIFIFAMIIFLSGCLNFAHKYNIPSTSSSELLSLYCVYDANPLHIDTQKAFENELNSRKIFNHNCETTLLDGTVAITYSYNGEQCKINQFGFSSESCNVNKKNEEVIASTNDSSDIISNININQLPLSQFEKNITNDDFNEKNIDNLFFMSTRCAALFSYISSMTDDATVKENIYG